MAPHSESTPLLEEMFPAGAAESGIPFIQFQRDFCIKSDVRLGQGVFGTVVKCVHRETEAEFALKIFKDSLTDEELEIHIVREKKVLCNLNQPGHDCVIKLFATTTSPSSQQHFIYEFAPNKDLNYWMRKRFWGIDALHIDCVRFYAAEVVLALEYLRSQSYVHRDIKAENILLDSSFHAKLAGFGLAKRINESRQALNLKVLRKKNTDMAESVFGAPELAFKEEMTFSTDLWNLGCLIFDMYTGSALGQEKVWATKDERYDLIEKGTYDWDNEKPRGDVVNVVNQLTRRKGKDRIGSENLQTLKVHPFFTDIDFVRLPWLPPPPMAPSDEYPARQLVIPEGLELPPLPHVIPGPEPDGGPEHPVF